MDLFDDDYPLEEDSLSDEFPEADLEESESTRQNAKKHRFLLHEDLLGMKLTTGSVTLTKGDDNLIGISIGGGAPYCPCLYVVQIFDNSPAAKDGTLEAGDEIIGVGNHCVKGKTKCEVAKLIQGQKEQVLIKYNKLHADPKQGKSLDIVLKKVKHRMVENMSTSAADALGLSRAILCNDSLIKKLEHLTKMEDFYRGLTALVQKLMKSMHNMARAQRSFGETFSAIGVREPQARASEVFTTFGDYHRTMEKHAFTFIQSASPVWEQLDTYLQKAIPDTKLTIKKYADAKFEYLSYCLKVKEMDDEEYTFASLNEPLYRVETGNYEYRLVLRCRQEARKRFAALRGDVVVKIDLLDQKHEMHITSQLKDLLGTYEVYQKACRDLMTGQKLFPIEMDLSASAFQYRKEDFSYTEEEPKQDDDDESLIECGLEASETGPVKETKAGSELISLLDSKPVENTDVGASGDKVADALLGLKLDDQLTPEKNSVDDLLGL